MLPDVHKINHMKRNIFISLIVLTLSISCNNISGKKDSSFTFRKGAKIVKLEFETKLLYLELNKPTKLIVSAENIDLQKNYMIIMGPGIRIIRPGKKGKNCLVCSVTAEEKYLVNHNLEIEILFDNGIKYEPFHKFLIPVI